jgi:aryl-alcohol dehydrogenase-like predicted oxidoreductase
LDEGADVELRSAGSGRRFAVAGKAVPAAILGTANLGSVLPDAFVSGASRADTFHLLDAMVDAGCTAFDLAASYQLGGTERLFGHWLRSRRHRDRLVLIGKGGHPYPIVRPNRVTPGALAADLDATLRRLGTEHLDLYLLHRDNVRARVDAIAQSLAAFHASGKIAAWGVSNWTHERLALLDGAVREAGGPAIGASSPHFSLLAWAPSAVPWPGSVSIAGDAQREARAFYERTQIPVLAWSPLGRGAFAEQGGAQRAIYDTPSNAARRERARTLAAERGATAEEIGLAYVLSQSFPAAAVTATSRAENMKRNLGAAELRLTPSEVRWLESGGDREPRPCLAPNSGERAEP